MKIKTIKSKRSIFLIILILSSFLRFYHINDQVPLIGDQGHDFLAARDFVLSGQIPLLGIASSVPRFHQGPLYVWLIALVFKIFGFNPLGPIIVASAIGLFVVGFTYILTQRYFGRLPAIIAGFTLAASPLAVIQSRMAFHTNAIPLFSLLYLYSLIHLLQDKHIKLFLPAFAFALLFQFELVAAPLILLIPLVLLLAKRRPRPYQLLHGFLGLVIGLLPQFVYDLTHHFQQLGLFIIWIGYRLIGFVGFDAGHTASPTKLINVLQLVFTYSQKFFVWRSPVLTALLLTTLFIGLINQKKHTKPIHLILIAWMLLMLIAFIVMGNASEAYFPVLFVPVSILLGLAINSFSKQTKPLLVLAVVLISLFNSSFLINNSFLTGPVTKSNPLNTYGAPLSEELAIVHLVNQKTNGNYHLIALGPGSQFPSFLDNYRYLLWWQTTNQDNFTGQSVWIQPAYLTLRLADSISYQFPTTTVSFSLITNH